MTGRRSTGSASRSAPRGPEYTGAPLRLREDANARGRGGSRSVCPNQYHPGGPSLIEPDRGTRNFDVGLEDPAETIRAVRSLTVGDILRQNARVLPDKPAIVHQDGRRLTYRELDRRSDRLAHRLTGRGFGRGDRLVLVSENRPAFFELLFAAAKTGMILATPLPRLSPAEHQHAVNLVDPVLVFVSHRQDEALHALRSNAAAGPVVEIGDPAAESSPYEGFLEGESPDSVEPPREPRGEDGLSIIYTSGTTGEPKAAVISHRALLARGRTWPNAWSAGRSRTDHVLWNPLAHVAGLDLYMNTLLAGGTCYTTEGFELETVLDRLRTADTRYFITFPGMLDPLIERADRREEDYRSLDVDYVGTTADLCTPETIRRITTLFDADFLNTFGQTETGLWTRDVLPRGTAPTGEELSKVESPFCEVRLVDGEGEPVPAGTTGELLLRGPTLFSGYLENGEATRSAFEGGWFHTGDVFRRLEDGGLQFVDRRANFIKSGGENIYPAEIERELLEHDGVDDACVVPAADERWGEVPRAFVVSGGEEPLDPRRLLEDLEARLARFKLPHYVQFVNPEDLPRGPHGEVLRGEMVGWELEDATRVRSP